MAESVIARGCLLVASPALLDPNFERAVVLVINHDEEGSYGLVLNRPLGHSLSEVLPDVDGKAAEIPVLQGGPVQTDMLQFVRRAQGDEQALLPGVSVGAGLSELLDDCQGVRAFLGYAGWGGGQLESETAEGSWIVAPAKASHVFEVPADDLWRRVLSELGGQYRWLAFDGGEPSDN